MSRGGQTIGGSATRFKTLEIEMVAALEQESIRLLLYTVHLFSCAISGLYEGQTTIEII